MWRRRPDPAALLYGPVAHDWHEEVQPGKGSWYKLPIFNHFDGRLYIYFIRRNIDNAAQCPDARPMSPELVEALDMIHSLANDPALHHRMAFEPGDMQIMHNHQIMPTAPPMKTGRNRNDAATCCACGSPRRTAFLCQKPSPACMAASRSAIAAA